MNPVDHLVYATPDLDGTLRELAARGLRLSPGGPHTGLGTRNHLADLGEGRYLEVIGPDPEQDGPPLTFGIAELTAPRLATWAVRVPDLDRLAAHPVAMSRQRPDGVTLSWRLAFPQDSLHGLVPFLIDWGASEHPSATAAPGARLLRLHGGHPEPEFVRARLTEVGADLDLVRADEPWLAAVIATPSGEVELR
ncbi:VOC family protein [Kutzneria viridogrisea]|uniref:Glyoxalase-like domain-containing protein n=2 Tax=Kutzneria TaxID=43356 RepID=W5W2R0_9PSEU|nr:VOC family protein [Kutzneria albida]AHH94786.1 hypothetical protein KALB_1413 [Kutzneria albida DSM 43870]MBA8930455.1 hypothetical protein [Kutzneria viridogrisea]